MKSAMGNQAQIGSWQGLNPVVKKYWIIKTFFSIIIVFTFIGLPFMFISFLGLIALVSRVVKKNPQFEQIQSPYVFSDIVGPPTCIIENGIKTSFLQIGQTGNFISLTFYPLNVVVVSCFFYIKSALERRKLFKKRLPRRQY